jgi:hypothetical protein
MSDVITDVGVRRHAVKTLLTNMHVALAKSGVATTLQIIRMALWRL